MSEEEQIIGHSGQDNVNNSTPPGSAETAKTTDTGNASAEKDTLSASPSTEAADAGHQPEKTSENAPKSQDPDPDVLDLDAEDLARLNAESLTDHPVPKLKELLQSSDSPSRFMIILSIAFGTLALACFALMIGMYVHARKAKKPVVEEKKAEAIVLFTQPLGEFKLFIKSTDAKNEERELRVDITVECATAETCELVKTRMTEARDLVLPVLSATTQEEWMGVETKIFIRRKILDRLASMNLPGKVLQVNFTDMTIERGH